MKTRSPLERYVDAIRNPRKHAYSVAYSRWVQRGSMDEDTPEPDVPAGLSVMGAQAVRIRVRILSVA